MGCPRATFSFPENTRNSARSKPSFDGFWERRLNAWDIAAGVVIVREAGGLLEPVDQGRDMLEHGNVICANEALFDPFAKLIRG